MPKTKKNADVTVAPQSLGNSDPQKTKKKEQPRDLLTFDTFIPFDCIPRSYFDFATEKSQSAQAATQANAMITRNTGDPISSPGHGGGLGVTVTINPIPGTPGDPVPTPLMLKGTEGGGPISSPGHGGGLGVTINVTAYPPTPVISE